MSANLRLMILQMAHDAGDKTLKATMERAQVYAEFVGSDKLDPNADLSNVVLMPVYTLGDLPA